MISHDQKKKILDKFSLTLPPTPPQDGILLLDKPSGPTSHDIVTAVRKQYQIRKVGHTGTLDPLASGLMILLLGKATKRAKEFEGLDKVYKVEAILGLETNTYDIEGQIISNASPTLLKQLTEDQVKKVLNKFLGPQKQKVPPFSAVKLNGKPLYKYAREGNPIPTDQLPVKDITIYDIQLQDFKPLSETKINSEPAELENYPQLRFKVHCSKGTYIRSLVHDLGGLLSMGASVSQLKRTVIGKHTL